MPESEGLEPHLASALEPHEAIQVRTRVTNGLLALSTRRLLVVDDTRVLLGIAIDYVRRIEFDIERDRPATLVIVPQSAKDERRSSGSRQIRMRRPRRP